MSGGRRLSSWWSGLRQTDRRALKVGAFILGPALLAAYGVVPYFRALREVEAQVSREAGLLEREMALLAESRGFGARFAAAEKTLLAAAPRLFSGEPIVATAALTGYLTRQATDNRVFLQRAEPGNATEAAPGVSAVRVTVRGVSDFAGILRFLAAVETGDKLLRVEELALTSAKRIVGRNAADLDEEILGLVATVVGYALQP